MKDFLGFKISTLHAWKNSFTIFDSFLDPGTSSTVSKTVFRLRGIPGYPGNIVPGLLACTIVCIHVHFFLLLEVHSTTTRPEDTNCTQKIGPNNLTCLSLVLRSKLAPTCSSLPLPTTSSSLILPHFRPLCSPNLGCQDLGREQAGRD
jgi:hypothetical protein